MGQGVAIQNKLGDMVKQVIAEVLRVELSELTEEMHFADDFGADSLDIIELIVKFETVFHINIPDEEIENIQTVGEAIAYIQNKVHEPVQNNLK